MQTLAGVVMRRGGPAAKRACCKVDNIHTWLDNAIMLRFDEIVSMQSAGEDGPGSGALASSFMRRASPWLERFPCRAALAYSAALFDQPLCDAVEMEHKKQVAALPVRRDEDGILRVLLVTSRETRRYVIPKGWPWRGVKDHNAAAEEAREEAGILGRIARKALGTYTYDKRRDTDTVPVRVKVFLLVVEKELDEWPESSQRRRVWFTPAKAAAAVDEPELAELIRTLDTAPAAA